MLFLVIPIHIATQSDPTVLHHHLDPVTRYPKIPLENYSRRLGDILVGALVRASQPDLDLFSYTSDAKNPLGSTIGSPLLSVAVNAAAKSHHSILDSNTNLRRLNGRLPLEFIHNMLLKFCIGLHGNFLLLDH